MYTVCDIIEKLMLIEKDAAKLYSDIASKFGVTDPMLSIMAKTLAKEEGRHVQYYENLKKDIERKDTVEIEFFLYDKAAKLLYEFKEGILMPELHNVQDLIKYALDFEKKNVGLLLDIQGRLVMNVDDASKVSYEAISSMIEEEKGHEKELQAYVLK